MLLPVKGADTGFCISVGHGIIALDALSGMLHLPPSICQAPIWFEGEGGGIANRC